MTESRASPPGDLKLIDGSLAVVMVDEMFVTHSDALLLSRYASLCQVIHDAMKQVINVCYCLPGSKRHVHLTVMFKELGFTVGALKAQ